MTQWQLDAAHSSVGFSVRHMMVTNVRGKFNSYRVDLNFDPANPAGASVEATLDAASIDTGVVDRDNHLRSADFLNAEAYPQLTFKSTRVEMLSASTAKIHGDLTIRDVTRPVVLDAEFLGEFASPFGNKGAAFNASTRINREDFGLTWNVALEAGGVLVGKEIRIDLELQVVQAVPATTA